MNRSGLNRAALNAREKGSSFVSLIASSVLELVGTLNATVRRSFFASTDLALTSSSGLHKVVRLAFSHVASLDSSLSCYVRKGFSGVIISALECGLTPIVWHRVSFSVSQNLVLDFRFEIPIQELLAPEGRYITVSDIERWCMTPVIIRQLSLSSRTSSTPVHSLDRRSFAPHENRAVCVTADENSTGV